MPKVTLELGGRTLAVAPASLKSVKRWLTALKETQAGSVEYLDEVEEFIFSALRRVDPDLDRDWLASELDETNIATVIAKVYEAGKLGAGETKGEAS
jgi:hypothetical protein